MKNKEFNLQEKLEKIDKNTQILLDEFIAYKERVLSGGPFEHHIVFETWIVQKISGLQVLLKETIEYFIDKQGDKNGTELR